jgi:two-component system heavy metal sensor histidine kinase CusS
MAEERDVQLSCDGDGVVLADPALLRRALANLVSNAVRYADAGSTVSLRATRHGEVMQISVTNIGVTIAPEHLPHLFERFYRADPARGHVDGSTGLGLAIVSAIMDLHGGTVAVHLDGATTRFTLMFSV